MDFSQEICESEIGEKMFLQREKKRQILGSLFLICFLRSITFLNEISFGLKKTTRRNCNCKETGRNVVCCWVGALQSRLTVTATQALETPVTQHLSSAYFCCQIACG